MPMREDLELAYFSVAWDEELSLDKTEYSMDLLDSLRLAIEYIKYWLSL